MKIIKSNYGIFLILFVTLFLVLIWFGHGRMLAGGEEGPWLYNSSRTFNLYFSNWIDIGTGFVMPFFLPRISLVAIATLFSYFSPAWMYQASLFWFLLASGGIGTFLLTKELLKIQKNSIPIFAGSFYVLNLYTQSQVWARFISTGMFAWAYLPVFLYFWVKWIRGGKSWWLVGLIISSLFYSNTFGTAAFIFTLWIPPMVLFAYEIFLLRNRKEIRKLVLRVLIGVFSWFILNLWWIYPYYILSNLSVTGFNGWKSNFDILRSVSQYFPTFQIILLRQSYLFGTGSPWYLFYSQPWTTYLSVGIFIISVIGLVVNRREKWWSFLITLSFLGWFISKGTNPPVGNGFFRFLFSTWSSTDALRNSYEKFGIVWLLPFSIFFALGLGWIYGKFALKIRSFVIILLVFSCGFLVWPMWTGGVFSKNLYINTPSYYQEANTYLNGRGDDGRILQLPIISGDSVGYDWGYRGVEPSEFLFDKSSASKILRAEYYDNKYLNLYKDFIDSKDYSKDLDEMNIKYLVLHNDLVSEASGASSSAQVRKILSKNPEIKFQKTFGELDVFEYTGNKNPGLFVSEGTKNSSPVYKKLSPTHFIVNIDQASEPFNLVFKETYDNLWEARIDGKKIDNHFLVYDYANGWKIDKKGSYSVEIIFKVWPWE
jgi:hypothetical protein